MGIEQNTQSIPWNFKVLRGVAAGGFYRFECVSNIRIPIAAFCRLANILPACLSMDSSTWDVGYKPTTRTSVGTTLSRQPKGITSVWPVTRTTRTTTGRLEDHDAGAGTATERLSMLLSASREAEGTFEARFGRNLCG
jgi:hypothetical protein